METKTVAKPDAIRLLEDYTSKLAEALEAGDTYWIARCLATMEEGLYMLEIAHHDSIYAITDGGMCPDLTHNNGRYVPLADRA